MPAETQTRINHPLSVTRFSTSLDVLTTSCCFVLFFSLWTCFSLWSGPHKYSDVDSMTYANCRSGYYHNIDYIIVLTIFQMHYTHYNCPFRKMSYLVLLMNLTPLQFGKVKKIIWVRLLLICSFLKFYKLTISWP